ncbi:hypothetical protein Ahy_B07g087855 isoform C [Arachis hypogaea]|uniref:Acid phosphatase n=1 Tax=Arachis hypogaea TaxID=3818 RepID=A0A444YD44_ARAHY|nr:hypothetical protein Ahy_B07g087855 isoform C [Arachis hypogaea]
MQIHTLIIDYITNHILDWPTHKGCLKSEPKTMAKFLSSGIFMPQLLLLYVFVEEFTLLHINNAILSFDFWQHEIGLTRIGFKGRSGSLELCLLMAIKWRRTILQGVSLVVLMRSSYVLESGFYITSFAATILITSLATIGLLMITMLVALAMMLQSCQSRGSGVIELLSVNDDYSYCKVHSLHTELNSLEGHNLPSICKDLAIEYVKGGRYARDLDSTKSLIEVYFDKVKPSDDGVGVVLMDIDGIFPLNPNSSNLYQRFHDNSIVNCMLELQNLKSSLVLGLCKKLQAAGWPIVLLSRGNGSDRNVTVDNLGKAGFGSCWSSLMMRDEDEDYSNKENEWISRKKNVIKNKGFVIKGIISSHMDALIAADTGVRNFLLPDPICDKFEQQRKPS